MCLPFYFPPAWGKQEGRSTPHPAPAAEKNLGKERSLTVTRLLFSLFLFRVYCVVSATFKHLMFPFCVFSSKFFYLENPNTLYYHWRLQCSLPGKCIITQLSLLQLPQPSFAEDFPGWNQEWESLAHTAGTCPLSMNILHPFTPFQEAYYFCRSGLKATSESWMAPKTSFKKKKKWKRWNILYKELFWALMARVKAIAKPLVV